MKRLSAYISLLLIPAMLCGCTAQETESIQETAAATEATEAVTEPLNLPDISQVRSICELAVLECDYHNVAKSIKPTSDGISGWFEKERTFWIEYVGRAQIGIDMTKVSMKSTGNVYTIGIPAAEILDMYIVSESFNEDSFVISKDSGIVHNEITADDQHKAIAAAQEKMEYEIMGDVELLESAQKRVCDLIANYFTQLGKISNMEFKIKFDIEENEIWEMPETETTEE